MHKRQSVKMDALDALKCGQSDYKTFKVAASFGRIPNDEFIMCDGYSPNILWNNGHEPHLSEKDHAVSRRAMYDIHPRIEAQLNLKLVTAIMNHCVRMNLTPCLNDKLLLWYAAILCGHPANCHIISGYENNKKGKGCSLSFQQLCDKVLAWESKF